MSSASRSPFAGAASTGAPQEAIRPASQARSDPLVWDLTNTHGSRVRTVFTDIYEAITGARSYQDPTPPERVCLVLARLAGDKLHTVLVKAFVNAITFLPVGSIVRTERNEMGVVVRTNHSDPLHPVVALADDALKTPSGQIDTAARDASGAYGAPHPCDRVATGRLRRGGISRHVSADRLAGRVGRSVVAVHLLFFMCAQSFSFSRQ
jgi:hypothetical protein